MTESFNEKLIELLKTDSRFVDDEGELVKAAVIDLELVRLLLSKPEIKNKGRGYSESGWNRSRGYVAEM